MEKLRKFETEEQFLNEKELLEYPQVSYTEDNEKVWIKNLVFYIKVYYHGEYNHTLTFPFEKGTLWKDYQNYDNRFRWDLQSANLYYFSHVLSTLETFEPVAFLPIAEIKSGEILYYNDNPV